MKWFYSLEGAQHGPVSEDEVKALISAGKLAPDDFVWHEGMAEWKPCAEVAALAVTQPTPSNPSTMAAYGSDAAYPYQPPTSQLEQDHPVQAGFIGYAGFWQRVAASIIDSLILMVLGLVMGVGLGVLMAVAGADDLVVVEAVGNLVGLVLGWLYCAMMESSSKQATVGKMALGIKVTDLDGNRIGFGRATGRHFGKIVSTLILLIGYLMMLWSPRKQTLHDSMAGCLVTRSR